MSEVTLYAAEQGEKNFKRLQNVHLKNGSSQGQILALTVFIVPNSLMQI
jgi:hypothetical protein